LPPASTCGVSTALVTFGSYDALSGSPVTAAGNVQVSCQLLSGSVAQVVAFDVGLSTGGSLGYNLYSDGGMATIWGDGTGGTQQQGGAIIALLVGTPVVANYTIYGKVPASQQVKGGSYSDTITVSMSF
jgi:spore coat protein U-like protein